MIYNLKNYASALLKRVGYTKPISVMWDQPGAVTASTNGYFIKMPQEFCGYKLDKRTSNGKIRKASKMEMAVAKGLVLHELGHSLQPLRKIAKAERETGLHHNFVNLLLDVQLERMIIKLYPTEIKYLYAMRTAVRRKMMAGYKADFKTAQDFPMQAQIINLIGRFRRKDRPYIATRSIESTVVTGKLRHYDVDTMRTPMDPLMLPDQVRIIAADYPELCDPALDLPAFPTMQATEFADEQEDIDENSEHQVMLDNCVRRVMDILDTVFIKVKRGTPLKEAIVLSAKLQMQLRKAESVKRITAPVNINRRQLASGLNYEPWSMDISIGKNIGRKASILIDVSGSMGYEGHSGSPLYQAFVAAQALTMAIEAQGGNVTGGQFGSYGVCDVDHSAAPLFSPVLVEARGTSFKVLSDIWMAKPQDTIFVITDGDGYVPDVIKPADYERTHVICLYDKVLETLYANFDPANSIPAGAKLIGQCQALAIQEMEKLSQLMLNIVN